MFDFISKKIGNKLIAIIVIVVLGPLVLSAYLASIQVEAVLHESLNKRISTSSQAAEKMLENFESEKLAFLRLFAGEKEFQQCLTKSCELQDILNTYLETAALDIIFVADSQGEKIASTGLGYGLVKNISKIVSLKDILLGAELSGIVRLGDQLNVIAVVPILSTQGKVLGVIGAAKILDKQIAKWIKYTTGADVSFFVGQKLEVTTLRGNKGELVRSIYQSNVVFNELLEYSPHVLGKQIAFYDDELEGRFSLLEDIREKPIGMILITLSRGPLFLALEKIRTNIALVAVFATFGAIIVAIFFAKKVTEPVYEIVTASKDISSGDLSKRAKVLSQDEIGELAEAFNEMTDSLQKTTVSKNYVDSIISSMAEGLIVFDPQGLIQNINISTGNLSGYRDSELQGMPINYLLKLPGDDAEKFSQTYLAKILEEGVVRGLDLYILSKSGEHIPISFSSSVMFDKQERRVGIVGVVKDMRQLRDMQAMLVQSEKLSAVGQLGAGVAHELNNPLAGIMSLVKTYLKKKEPGTREHELLLDMQKASQHMAKIVRDLGDFSKQSSGDFDRLDCNEVIESALSFSTFQLKKKGVKLQIAYADDLPEVLGDKSHLQQVVINFLTNAADAMNEGGIFKITTSTIERNGQKFAQMEFADNGMGIEPDILEKIFDPFFTTKRPGGGTGLGLSITHTIVKNHKGDIRVDSKPGQGTMFTVTLPAAS